MIIDKLFNGWVNVTSDFRNELVFTGRNQEYGAYQLRKNYNKYYTLALLITIGALIAGIGVPKLLQVIIPKDVVVGNVDTQLDLEPPPVDKDEPEPPPPPPPPPPPVQEMIKFIPPVVVDEIIKPEDLPPPQDKLIDQNVGKDNQKGTGDDDNILPDLGGDGDKPIDPPKAPEIFTAVQEMPEFIGGEAAMMKFIYENIQYPEQAKANGVEGKLRVKFTVTPDGSIKNAHIISKDKLGSGLEEEAIRVIQSMPKWKPGRQNGNAVHVYFNLPITFKLF